MKTQHNGNAAKVLAGALRNWANTTPSDDHAARLVVRQPPAWEYVATIGLTRQQTRRVLGMLRQDLATQHRPEDALDSVLDEHRAAGRRRIRAEDLAAAAHRIGQPTAWIAARLTHLADQGHIRETWRPGTYRI